MDFKIPLESEVVLPGYSSSTGILKFVGQVKGKAGTYAGVEIIGNNFMGKNNGDVDGIQYFKTSRPLAGLFLPYVKLLNANLHLQTPVRTRDNQNSGSPRVHTFLPQPSTASSSAMSSPRFNKETRRDTTATAQQPSVREDLERHNRQLLDMNRELKAKLNRYENELSERTTSLIDLQQCLDELEKEISNKEKRLIKQKKSYDQQRDELRDAIRTLQEQLEENANLYSEEIQRLSDNNGNLEQEEIIKRHNDYMENTSQQLLQFKTEIIESHKALELKNEEVKNLKNLLKKVQEDKANVEKMMVDVEYQLELKSEKIKELETEVINLKTSKEHNMSDREEEIADLKNLLEKSQILDEYKMEIERLELELQKLRKSIQSQDVERNTIESLKQESETLNQAFKDLEKKHRSEIKQINEQHVIDLRMKQEIVDSLSKKILELESQNEIRQLKDITNHNKTSSYMTPHHQNNFQHKPPISLSERPLNPKRSFPKLRKVASNITINESSISQLVDGELMVYIPENKVDPTAGREKWCGLCEKQGHDSVDCENF